jgi:hypothetical protein
LIFFFDTDTYKKDAEEKFNFAVTARERFNTDDYALKTEIIRELGSNLFLKDGKITVQQEYPWLFMQKANRKLAVLKEQGFEPEKSIDEYEKTGTSNAVISTLQARKESNLRQGFWRPLFYR